jgi:DNA-directed RNA polymerase subunit RPC12/RpoP
MEAFVELVCPECSKHWEASLSELPGPKASFDCPDCGSRRPLSEFARTSRDLEVIRDSAE